MSKSISDFVAATLTKLGLPVQTCIMLTMLVRDRRFAGYRFSYDGGCAILRAGGNTLDLYDNSGQVAEDVVIGGKARRGQRRNFHVARFGEPVIS